MKKPELLSPASNWPMLVAAINAGADSVYFGLKQLNMRATAKNFELRELKKIADYCHKNNVKAYLTLNTIIYEDELKTLNKILNKAKEAKIDAVICWDLAVIQYAKKIKMPIILSTQASVSNSAAIKEYEKVGVKRITLARECSLEQIKNISKKTKLEIEVFIHGAMCVSISGRCFISQFLFNKSANRGECLQPCRRSYIAKDAEEGHELEIENHYVMSPKDLCTLPFIEKLIEAKIDCFKIEGRARSPEYIKVVTEVYREAIDAYFDKKLNEKLTKNLAKKLEKVYNRGFSSGFYLGKPLHEWNDVYGSKATERKFYLGKVLNYYRKVGVAEIKIENKNVKIGDKIIIIGNKTGVVETVIKSMKKEYKKIDAAKKGSKVGIKINDLVRENDKVYVVENARN